MGKEGGGSIGTTAVASRGGAPSIGGPRSFGAERSAVVTLSRSSAITAPRQSSFELVSVIPKSSAPLPRPVMISNLGEFKPLSVPRPEGPATRRNIENTRVLDTTKGLFPTRQKVRTLNHSERQLPRTVEFRVDPFITIAGDTAGVMTRANIQGPNVDSERRTANPDSVRIITRPIDSIRFARPAIAEAPITQAVAQRRAEIGRELQQLEQQRTEVISKGVTGVSKENAILRSVPTVLSKERTASRIRTAPVQELQAITVSLTEPEPMTSGGRFSNLLKRRERVKAGLQEETTKVKAIDTLRAKLRKGMRLVTVKTRDALKFAITTSQSGAIELENEEEQKRKKRRLEVVALLQRKQDQQALTEQPKQSRFTQILQQTELQLKRLVKQKKQQEVITQPLEALQMKVFKQNAPAPQEAMHAKGAVQPEPIAQEGQQHATRRNRTTVERVVFANDEKQYSIDQSAQKAREAIAQKAIEGARIQELGQIDASEVAAMIESNTSEGMISGLLKRFGATAKNAADGSLDALINSIAKMGLVSKRDVRQSVGEGLRQFPAVLQGDGTQATVEQVRLVLDGATQKKLDLAA